MFLLPENSAVANIKKNRIESISGKQGERRVSAREPTNDLSEIISDKGKAVCSCVVHNISQTGAMLEVTSNQVPGKFILSNHVRKTKVLCHVVWQCGNLMGVEFFSKPRPVGQTG